MARKLAIANLKSILIACDSQKEFLSFPMCTQKFHGRTLATDA